MGHGEHAWSRRRRCFWIALTIVVCWREVIPFTIGWLPSFPFVAVHYQRSPFLRDLRPQRNDLYDFFQEWASARNYFTGLPTYLDQKVALRRHLGYEPPDPHKSPFFLDHNAHPPTSVLLALPLGLLDYPDAFLAWTLLSFLALALSLTLTVRELRIRWSWWALLPTVTLLLLCNPFRQQVIQGQWNLFLLLLLTAAWLTSRRGWEGWTGVWLGAATAIKIFPGFLLLYFAWRRRWRTVAAGVCTLLVLTGLTAGVLSTDTYISYVRDVMPTLGRFQNSGIGQSVFGFWGKLFNPNNNLAAVLPPATPDPASRADVLKLIAWDRVEPLYRSVLVARVGAILSALALVGLAASAVRPGRAAGDDDRAFSLAVTVMLLVSPTTWDHYFLLLLVPLAILWVRLPTAGFSRWVFRAVLVGLWINVSFVFDLTVPGGLKTGIANPWHSLTALSYEMYALLALFVLLLRSDSPRGSAIRG